jgi:hypothetical protein
MSTHAAATQAWRLLLDHHRWRLNRSRVRLSSAAQSTTTKLRAS